MAKITGRELKALIRRLSDVKLEVPQIQKQGNFTCWAGCYRMIDAYHGTTIPFSQYLKLKNPECTLTGCDIKPCPACDKPRLIADVLRDLRKLSYKGTASFTTNPTVAEIKGYLMNKTPLMIFKHNGAAVGHFVLVTGVVMKGLFMNQFLIVNDPDLHKKKIVDVLDVCLRHGTWSQTWVVSK